MTERRIINSNLVTRLNPDATQLRHGDLLYTIHELSRLISTHFDKVMEPHNLTRAQWWAIMHIMLNEGQSQSDLARVMQMGRSAAGKLFDRLEAKGWIERRPDKDDQRVLCVFLLEGVSPVFDAIVSGGPTLFETLLDGISEQEERALLSGLDKIRINAERAMGVHGRTSRL
ncbi:MarR family transcriptional regulator [Agrobacterium rhizogenes]|nr:MarR family transcriptional regulator [Rhizobium rhizogenes]NTG65104.1 MarR family transcriptional regulator [Rhizobium rhizogenes]NTG71555.1 MarR family transcriptional regulator [Rhizobium rhizogenes]NTG84454.1 MarR family transcriptional regulator [Rhizobium rhizogenes]NTG90848.1 MarR family transcriptional regulator [Rhizobium rhizogenes]NTH29482.1 MarR family transcriptional regulator [Rhizobium rhizogenes]